jgi:DNA repair protein RecN (Recombination protein N)
LLSQVGDILLEQGEYDDIMAALSTAEHSEALARAAKEAYGALAGDGGAMDTLGTAVGALDGASGLDGSLAARVEALREALYAAEDVSRELSGYMEAIDFDAAELERMQEIAAQYQSLMRKWGPTIADVASKADAARELVESVDGGEEALARFAQAAEAAEGALVDAADALSRVRESVAPRFADDVTAAMSRLCMGSARFECEVVRQPRSAWTCAGADVVQFMYRPAAEMSARPLARIASGGELSRVLLAIYVSASKNNSELEEGFVKSQLDVYGTNDAEALPAAGLDETALLEGACSPSPSDSPTYIFDEIDAGVGGETALALAAELARLAQNRQVIAVTHLAQVAAAADAHFVVEKVEAEGVAQTRIREVVGDERVAELARMLSGRPTDASLAHARELLEAAD